MNPQGYENVPLNVQSTNQVQVNMTGASAPPGSELPNYDEVPQDNTYTPSQDQVAAILPSLDNVSSSERPNDDGVGCMAGCRQAPNACTWILTILFWGMLAGALIGLATGGSYFWVLLIIAVGVYIGNLVESGCSAMRQYLSNVLEQEGAAHFVERLKAAPIEIWWTVQCWHNETRFITEEHDGRTTTRTEQERVNTWRATQQFQYSLCVDNSSIVSGLDEHKVTRLRLRKTFEFANDGVTQQSYINEQEMFRRMNWRDQYQDFHEETKINGYVKRILAEREPGTKPDWMSLPCFWLCSVLACSPCFRQRMVAKCGNVDFVFVKQITK